LGQDDRDGWGFPEHNRGFKGYLTVNDLEKRFAEEERQYSLPFLGETKVKPKKSGETKVKPFNK